MHAFVCIICSTHINVYRVLSEALASQFAVLRACIAGYTQERLFECSGSIDVDVLFMEQTVSMMMMMMTTMMMMMMMMMMLFLSMMIVMMMTVMTTTMMMMMMMILTTS